MTKRQLAVVSLMTWKPPLLVLMVVQTSRCDVALLFKVTEGKKKRSWDYEFAKGGEVEKWCYCCCLLLSVVSGQGASWDIDSTVTDVEATLLRKISKKLKKAGSNRKMGLKCFSSFCRTS